jgi:2-iminobutanoate/2-iminopropanoate deaminase
MPRDVVISDAIAPPVGPFSAAVRSRELIFLSGLVAQDPATGDLVGHDVTAQTERVLRNLRAVLEAAGKTPDDVVRVGVYLTDMGTFGAMNAVYEKYFQPPYRAHHHLRCCAAARRSGGDRCCRRVSDVWRGALWTGLGDRPEPG